MNTIVSYWRLLWFWRHLQISRLIYLLTSISTLRGCWCWELL